MSALDVASEADVLRVVADYIDEHGWTQGNFEDSHGCVCAIGAFNRVPWTDEALGFVDEAFERLSAALSGGGIISWNDAPGRTQAEVTAKLREVAASLDGAA